MSSWRLVADIFPCVIAQTKMWREGWKGNGEQPLLFLNFMVHRHSLTFRHSQGEAHITSHETRNEQAKGAACLGPGQSFSQPWGSTPRHQGSLWWPCSCSEGRGVQPRLGSSKPVGSFDQLHAGWHPRFPRAYAVARVSTRGLPTRLQEAQDLGRVEGGEAPSQAVPMELGLAGNVSPSEAPMGWKGGRQ